MTGPAPSSGGSPGGSGHIRDRHTDHTDENLRTMPPNRLTLALLCSPRTRSPTLTLGHRCALSGPARSASGLSALFPRRERPTHVTRDKVSVCGGVSRGTWPGRCRVPIRGTEGTPDPHSPGVHTAGCATGTGPIACVGLACGDDARAPRHRASGPRRPLPAPRVWRGFGATVAPPALPLAIAALGRLVDVSRDPVRRKGDGPKRRRARRAGPKPSKLATPSGDKAEEASAASLAPS